MMEELMRSGEDTRGSTGLRLPRLRGFLVPPRPVPALLADCGVLNRFCTARLRLEGFWLLADELDGRCVLSSAGSESLGEMRPVWYDIACGSASGLTCCGETQPLSQRGDPNRNVEQIANFMTIMHSARVIRRFGVTAPPSGMVPEQCSGGL